MEVQNHSVKYYKKFHFPTKMTANASSGILEACKCRVSIRMEEKGGRHFRKLGFVDVNLAEYAGAGPSTQRYILQPYDSSHRLDNSIVQLSLNIVVKEGDPIFKRPFTRTQPILLPGEEARRQSNIGRPANPAPSANGTSSSTPQSSGSSSMIAPAPSSGEGTDAAAPSIVSVAGGSSQASSHNLIKSTYKDLVNEETLNDPASHTRNSSTTSQVSQGSGYGSQSSQPIPTGVDKGHSRASSSGGESNPGRNFSSGSTDTGFSGSMEKRQRDRMGVGRVDAATVIDEILEGVGDIGISQDDGADSSGLQLYVGKDGTVTFNKNTSRTKDYEPVVIDRPR